MLGVNLIINSIQLKLSHIALITGVPQGINSLPAYPGYAGLDGDSLGDDIRHVSSV